MVGKSWCGVSGTMVALAMISFSLFAAVVPAAVVTWDGGGGNLNWGTAANWNPDGVPANGSTIQFNGGIAADSTVAVNVGDNVYTIAGNSVIALNNGAPLTLNFAGTGGYKYFPTINVGDAYSYVLNSASGSSFAFSSTGLQTFDVAAGGRLAFSGNFVVSGYSTTAIKKTGAGELDLATSITNFQGGSVKGLDVQGGTLRLRVPNGTLWDMTSAALKSSNGADIYFTGSGSTVRVMGTVNLAGGTVYLNGVTLRNDSLTANWTGSTAAFDIAADAAIDIRGRNTRDPIVGALTGSGQVANTYNNAPASFTLGADNGNGDFLGQIRGNGTMGNDTGVTGLIKIGSGTQVLSGMNTYSGGTTINAGTLQMGSAEALGAATGGLTVSGGTLDLNGYSPIVGALSGTGGTIHSTLAGALLTVDSVVSTTAAASIQDGAGSTALIKQGTGVLALTGTNTYSGETRISAGGLQAMPGVGLSANSNLVLEGGVFQGSGTGTFDRALGTSAGQVQWAGDGGFSAAGGVLTVNLGGALDTLVWGSTANFVGEWNQLTFGTATANSQVLFQNPIDLNAWERTVAVTAGAGGDSALLSGSLSNGGLNKQGTGLLILGGNNTYSDGTFVNAGLLSFSTSASLPANGALMVAEGGYLGANIAATQANFLDRFEKFSSAGVLGIEGTFSGPIDLTGFSDSVRLGTRTGATIDAASAITPPGGTYRLGGGGGTLTVNTTLDGSGDSLEIGTSGAVPAGIVFLAGSDANTYAGETALSAGKLILGKPAGTNAIGGNLSIATSSGYANSGNGVELAASQQIPDTAEITFFGADWSVFRLKGFDETVAGISCANGKGIIENFGDGQANLDQNAVLTVNVESESYFRGIMRGVTTHGNSTLGLVKNGEGTMTLDGAALTNTIIHTGPTTVNAGTLRLVQALGFSSPITNLATVEFYSTDSFASKNNSVYTNAIRISGGTVNKTGSGQVRWQGSAIKVTGQINIQEGLLGADALTAGWTQNAADIDIAAGAVLDLRGSPISLDALSGAGDVHNTFANGVNLFTVGVGGGSGVFSGVIYGTLDGNTTDGTPNRGRTSLVKTGAGTQTLTGASVYNGPTTVNNGTLVLAGASGTIAASSGYTVNGPGILRLDNSTESNTNRLNDAGAVTLQGGTLDFVGGPATGARETVTLVPGVGDSTLALSGSAAPGTHILTATLGTRAAGATLNISGSDAKHLLVVGSWSDGFQGGGYFSGGNYAWYVALSPVRAINYASDPDCAINDGSTSLAADKFTQLTGLRSGQDSVTVGSLNLAGSGGGVTLNDFHTLTLSTGGLLKTGGGDAATISGGNDLTSAAVDLVVRTETAADRITIATPISGAIGLTKSGPGTLVLTGANTYNAGTFINAGMLQVGTGAWDGELGAGNIVNNGELVFKRDGMLAVPGNISGSGSMVLNGPGTVTLLGIPSYAGTTTINAGTLSFSKSLGADAWRGGLITVNAGAVLDANVQAPFGYPSAGTNNVLADIFVNGGKVDFHPEQGTLQIRNLRMNGGMVDLLNNGTSMITYGDVTVDAGSTADVQSTFGANAAFDLRNPQHDTIFDIGADATLNIFVPLTSTDYGGNKKGLNKTGGGTLVLAADNAYTGGTTINGGTLQVGNGGAAGNLGTGNVVNNAALVFNREGLAIVPGSVSGTGSITKTGPGALVLRGAASYTGGTVLDEGLLSFGVSLPSAAPITVPTGTYLGVGFAAGQENFLDRLNKSASAGVLGVEATTSGNLDLTGFDANVRLGSRTGGTLDAATVITPPDSTYRFGGGGGSLTVKSRLTGARDVEIGTSGVLDAGTVVLGGANDYTGATKVQAGTLRLLPRAVVADPALWLDAGDLGTITFDAGGTVAEWRDRGGNGDKVGQTVVSRQPSLMTSGSDLINGLPVVKFSGPSAAGQCLTNAVNYASPVSVFYVSKLTGGGNYRLLGAVANNWLLGYWNGAMDEAYFNGWVNDPGSPANTDPRLYEAVIPGGTQSSAVYVYDAQRPDVTQFANNAGGTAGPNGISLGGGNGSNAEYSNGVIGELLIYSRALDAAKRALVENYLIEKWFGSGAAAEATDYIPDGSPVTLAAGTVFDLAGNMETIGSLAGHWESKVLLGGGTLTTGGNGGTTAFSGEISGNGRLVKTGGGTLALSGVNSYEDGTTVREGILEIQSATALPAGQTLTIEAGGTLVLSSGLSAAGASAAGTTQAVPEPGTLILLLTAGIVAALAALRRTRLP